MSVEMISSEMLLLYPIMIFIGFSFFALVLSSIFGPSKSKAYRQDLSNMYVAGKIKQIAEKDDIDLDKEFLEFARITKNKKIDMEALDTTVERELQEKLAESRKETAPTEE